ncbi:hypothetical protein QBC44DRAFT_291240 [Cladorrhinum sp. PSN332]|nr:hypothetical protein QBC44DRAFT_291240 [Cladorrhinum sp. PSN332]
MPSSPPPINLSLPAFLASSTSLIVLAGLFVIARVVVNLHKTKKFLLEDGVAVFALVFLAAGFALVYTSAIDAKKPDVTVLRMLQLSVAYHFTVSISIWSAKVPILLLIVRLFGINNWLRITSYVVMAGSFVIFLVCMALTGAKCAPTSEAKYNNIGFLITCANTGSKTGVVIGGTAVAMDVIILILPLPVLSQLRLPARQKIGLFVVFLSGTLAIAASAVSLYFKTFRFGVGATDMTSARMLGSVIDCSIAIIVGCVPATYAFWNNYIATSTIYSRIRQRVSSLNVSAKSWAHPTHISTSPAKSLNADNQQLTNNSREYGNHEYFKMESRDQVYRPGAAVTAQTREEV